jgi:ADP-heptose:LPS heptosyltransferase
VLDSELSPALRVPRPGPYVYRGAAKRAAARILDWAGDFWLAPQAAPLDWKSVSRVAVLRLDHLGDLLNAFPTLQALRKRLPKAHIALFVGPWGAEIAKLCPAVSEIVVVDAPWFQRPRRVEWPWGAIAALGKKIREGNFDLALELRGDLRHHLALFASGTRLRAGHAVTAGRFLLTHPARYDNTLHEVDQNLALLGEKGGRVKAVPPKEAVAEAAAVMAKLKIRKGFTAIQAACGTEAKRWMPERWAALIKGLPKGTQAVLLGSASERAEMAGIAGRCGARRPINAAGTLSLPGLAALLKQAGRLISVDSGPAHLAAAVGTPVLALYSGTNLASQWAPRGARVLRAEVPCSPCELSVCPYGNECMRRISVDEALSAL